MMSAAPFRGASARPAPTDPEDHAAAFVPTILDRPGGFDDKRPIAV